MTVKMKVHPDPKTRNTVSEEPDVKARTVLYVEDDQAGMQFMDTLLARVPGVKMIGAETGKAGIELAERHKPDVIILDINLPDMNGFDILGYLKVEEWTENIPVIPFPYAEDIGKEDTRRRRFL
ncbi:MAG: response regulator [Proteobacteria bacterium]|nr:response regulator [Pseudomonadota bacterium]MDA1023917.1 response regulator [Pseudomonadota bacterium]